MSVRGSDNYEASAYIGAMSKLLIMFPLFALLAVSLWFAAVAWEHFDVGAMPAYGWAALAGGTFMSLLVGGGLMALIFYSSRHGYDDLSGGDGDNP